MAINIKFDLSGNPEPPTIILANRNGNKFGQLEVEANSIELKDSINDASEISFTLNKYIDGRLTNLWDKVLDFKLIYCKEWDMWFEIKVELDEATKTIKTVFGTQLGKAELSQIMLYNVEINTEKDIERDDYKISILYDGNDPEASILHRLLEKAPHYGIAYVDPSIATIQRSFSFDDTSICDAFQEIAESIDCVFVYHSGSDGNGMPQRAISVYSSNQCGQDTLIFVTSDELATEGIRLTTDTDAVKNCYKLEAGDELMTATIRNCNPSGTDYIWCFSNRFTDDMSGALVSKLESYSGLQDYYANSYISEVDSDLLGSYNSLANKYSSYNSDLQAIATPIKGYAALTSAHYNAIDLELYLKSGLMPSIVMSETNAKEQVALLTAASLSPVAVANAETVSLATANGAVLAMAKVVVKSTYKVQVNTSSLSEDKKTWTGDFIVTNYSDEEDSAISETISVEVNDDLESFIEQKIEKALNKENTDNLSISGLFEKEYDNFCENLQKYSLNSLISLHDACQACIDILIEQGVPSGETWSDDTEGSESNLYEKLYVPYYNKLTAIEAEMKIREDEISIVEELKKEILSNKEQIHEALDFEKYLGNNLWLEFCAYRREGKYSNENYISDGLNNKELFDKAREFISAAEGEIVESSELQHSISTTLNNLFAIAKFKSLVESFEIGNWIRVQINDEIYKLRLISYEINYGDFNKVSVEFSDVITMSGGVSEVKSILSKASSMASTYEDTKKQSQQGSEAKVTIGQWLEGGLNSALVRIQNNDAEEITFTKNGLLARSYDDITETYSPEQFKLTHNIMAYTEDNWKTVSTALGKHLYTYWDGSKFVNGTDYGLSTKFMNAGYIIGSQMISGEILSDNYAKGKSGTYFNLRNGNFEIAGGKLAFDGDTLTLKDTTIEWSNTNSPDIKDISGLDEYLGEIDTITDKLIKVDQDISDAEENAKKYSDEQNMSLLETLTKAYEEYTDSEVGKLDQSVANYLGLGGSTLIGDKYIISPYIAGGYLNITGTTNNLRVVIDPNNLTGNNYAFQVLNGDLEKVVMGVDGEGNAEFCGAITATSLTLDGATIPYEKIDDKPTKLSEFENDLDIASTDYVQIETQTDESTGIATTTTIVGDKTYTTYTSADANYLLTNIGMGSVNPSEDDIADAGYTSGYFKVSKEGLLIANNAIIWGTIYATDGRFSGDIVANSLELRNDMKIGNNENSYHTWISTEGVLNAWGANVTNINAINGTFNNGTFNDVEIIGGSLKIGANDEYDEASYHTWISEDGVLNASGVNITGVINATSGGRIGGWEITNSGIIRDETGLMSDDAYSVDSIVASDTKSPIRFYAGKTQKYYTVTNIMYENYELFNNGDAQLMYVYKPSWDVLDISNFKSSITFCNKEFELDSVVSTVYYKNGTIYIYVNTSNPNYSNANISAINATFEYVDFNTTILDDGSLYAKAANIEGNIYATDGSFYGQIEATKGSIGQFHINGSSISTDNGNLSFTTDGLIATDKLHVNEYLQTEELQIKKISGRNENSPYLLLESEATQEELVMVSATYDIIEKGTTNWFGGVKTEGQIMATVKTSKPLAMSKTFTIYATYIDNSSTNGTKSTELQATVVIPKNGDTASVTFPHLYEWNETVRESGASHTYSHSCTIDRVYPKPNIFYQPSTNIAMAIASSSSFVPYTDGLNLGSLDQLWHYVYRINESDGSDRKIKDNINDINCDFSKQLIDGLMPKSYIFKTAKTPRIHYGFIAQDVEELLHSLGTNTSEVGLVCKSIPEEPDGENNYYGLNYTNLIAPMVSVIQQLSKQVEKLEEKIDILENK